MPWRPPSHAVLTRSRPASDQRATAARRARHGPDPRGTMRWRRLRARVLRRQPLCMDPFFTHAQAGQIIPATEVDHRLGVWERPDLVWDESNLQALCTACHHRKSAAERRASPASNP